MTQKGYDLSNEFLRTTQRINLWKGEKGIVEVDENVPVIPVTLDDNICGYVFGGKGKLVVDTIVETTKGAIGEPVEREINHPFSVIGDTTDIRQSLKQLPPEKFNDLEMLTKEELREKAENLLNRLFSNHSVDRKRSSFNEVSGLIFAFPNEEGNLDLLICKDHKLVFTSTDRVFVSKGNKEILKSRGGVVVSKPGKSVFMSKGESSTFHVHKNRT